MTHSNLPQTLGDRVNIDYCKECKYQKNPEINVLLHHKLKLDNGKYIDLYECENKNCKGSLYLFDYEVLESNKVNFHPPRLLEFKDEYLELMMRVKRFFKAKWEEKSLEVASLG